MLKISGANLLGGRGKDRLFHPFVYPELRDHEFRLERALNHGLIPSHYLADDPDESLASYVGRYFTEEISGEGVSRNLLGFSRFLQVASLSNGQLVNYTAVASDSQVSRATVQLVSSFIRYFACVGDPAVYENNKSKIDRNRKILFF